MLFSIVAFASAVAAWSAPNLTSYNLVWQDDFCGDAGLLPNDTNWNIVTNISVNNEWQQYTTHNTNLQVSGGDTLQIVPLLAENQWTSGRIESKYTWAPASGKKSIGEAVIRFGENAIDTKKGMWPAFWMLSETCRTNGTWPECGEIDILETVNGHLTGYGTVHCDTYPGGLCHEPTGIQSTIEIPNQSWHRWRLVVDRTSGNWRTETLQWYMDNTLFQTITGAQIGDESVWSNLAHSAKYFILNVAVGGNWPGATNNMTADSWGSMMEVAYVAHYES
ncbi:hypothetical protein TD95_003650, partial [Thielaviopsis punctulata]